MKTRIIYEDNEILVCYKVSGLAVQSMKVSESDMESELRNYLHGNVYIIHRLDQPVSGVLVFAKTKKAAAALNSELTSKRMEKVYRALVCGEVLPKEGTLTDYMIKKKAGLGEIVPNGTPGSACATLSYKTIMYNQCTDVTEIEVVLETGRFHQIRLQCAGMSHPIVGDSKYGGCEAQNKKSLTGKTGLCLVAFKLSFTHPSTGKRMTFYIPDFAGSLTIF